MSVIAIKGIPQKWTLISTVKYFKKIIPGSFEALNFGNHKQFYKTVYIGLSEFMNPAKVIELVHNATIHPKLKLHAYMPNTLPDIAVASKRKPKPRPPKPSKRAKLENESPYEVIQRTHHELLLEIQYKYPGLYNLSQKTGHKLLEEIANIIFDRVKNIMGSNIETRENCFKLSGHYRKLHPHDQDFEMIVDTLHTLQDKSGAPHAQIQEKELLLQPVKPYTIDDVPLEDIKSACNNYSGRILLAVSKHVQALDCKAGDAADDVARKKVREEMKKIVPYMASVLKQVVAKHFMPQQAPMHRIRIYGEPFLPPKEAMSPFVARYHGGASRVLRHPRMYNLLLFRVPRTLYAPLMAMDGTIVNGAKLVIRSDIPVYSAPAELRAEMSAALGGPRHAPPLDVSEHYDFDVYDGRRMEP